MSTEDDFARDLERARAARRAEGFDVDALFAGLMLYRTTIRSEEPLSEENEDEWYAMYDDEGNLDKSSMSNPDGRTMWLYRTEPTMRVPEGYEVEVSEFDPLVDWQDAPETLAMIEGICLAARAGETLPSFDGSEPISRWVWERVVSALENS